MTAIDATGLHELEKLAERLRYGANAFYAVRVVNLNSC
jgi:hypothetical protein